MRKRGQEGATAAAALIAIIALLIVLYILVIPPSEREKILEGEEAEDDDVLGDNLTLLELEQKKFLPSDQKEFEQSIPAINLYLSEEGTELKRVDTLYVEKSLVSEKKTSFDFEIISLDDTKNVLLNFIMKKAQGRLIIKLNDNEIYNSEVFQANIEPIKLNDYLKEGKNNLEFAASSPGIGFWRTNFYSLENVIITADIISRDAQESRNIFLLTSSEKQNMEKVKLRFFPQCNVADVGRLEVWVNNYNLYSAVPDCGSPNLPIEFSPSHLVTGENILKFRTERGRYLLEQIKLTADLKKVEPPIYYFTLKDKQFESVRNNTHDVMLYMRFVDDESAKEADITVNGNKIRLDQTEISYSQEISNYVERGNNVIKIDPEETIDIVDLKIQLESD